jgi:hypothetical protein
MSDVRCQMSNGEAGGNPGALWVPAGPFGFRQFQRRRVADSRARVTDDVRRTIGRRPSSEGFQPLVGEPNGPGVPETSRDTSILFRSLISVDCLIRRPMWPCEGAPSRFVECLPGTGPRQSLYLPPDRETWLPGLLRKPRQDLLRGDRQPRIRSSMAARTSGSLQSRCPSAAGEAYRRQLRGLGLCFTLPAQCRGPRTASAYRLAVRSPYLRLR